MIEFHKATIKYTIHASNRLKERFHMKTDEVRHCLKTGKHIKKVNKDGELGLFRMRLEVQGYASFTQLEAERSTY